MKNGFNKVQKNISGEETANIKNFTGIIYKTILWPFFFMETFLQPYNIPGLSLEYFWNRNLWNVLQIFWKHWFVISGICQKINICYRQIIHFQHKNNYSLENFFLKKVSFKIFPKFSLDARNIATPREHSANIPGILRAGWILDGGKRKSSLVDFIVW